MNTGTYLFILHLKKKSFRFVHNFWFEFCTSSISLYPNLSSLLLFLSFFSSSEWSRKWLVVVAAESWNQSERSSSTRPPASRRPPRCCCSCCSPSLCSGGVESLAWRSWPRPRSPTSSRSPSPRSTAAALCWNSCSGSSCVGSSSASSGRPFCSRGVWHWWLGRSRTRSACRRRHWSEPRQSEKVINWHFEIWNHDKERLNSEFVIKNIWILKSSKKTKTFEIWNREQEQPKLWLK